MAAPGLPTRGPHLFVEDPDGAAVTVTGAEAHHLVTVLRARPGDAVSVGDGAGSVWQGEVLAAERDAVRMALGTRYEHPPPEPRLTVVHALPKGRKLDEVVQRLVELGVDRLVPVESARSAVRLEGARRAKAQRRWQAVALAAAKQSRRAWLPQVAPVTTWAEGLAGAAAGAVLWEEASTPLGTVVDGAGTAVELTLAVGPEGGLTADEVAAARLRPAALGATILRTETAAVVAAAIVLHRVGRLG